MQPDDIKITTHERLDNETAGQISQLNGKSLPYGQVGTIVEETTILCADCATTEELSDAPLIQPNDEWDYPGATCDECHKKLDTYLLVYKSQDPELWHKLVWSEQLGQLQDPILNDEKLAKIAENQAYEMGYQEGSTIENQITQSEAENHPHTTEYPTDSAHYANNVLPELRAISGYIDSMGKGMYQEAFRDISYTVYNDGVNPAFHDGYYDRIMNNREKWDSREKHTFED